MSGGSFAPGGDQVSGGGVVLGGSGAQHDVVDLDGVRATSDLGFELAQSVVDLVPALGELADAAVRDPIGLPSRLSAGPPTDPQMPGQMLAHLGSGARRANGKTACGDRV